VPVALVVPAAGRGTRLGPGAPKALRDLAGTPLLVHALRSLLAAPSVRDVVVSAPADEVAAVDALCRAVAGDRLRVVAGGDDRRDSVRRALAVLAPDVDVVLVSDAARPFVPVALTEAVVDAVRLGAPAVVPGLRLADTVKQVDAAGHVVATLPREHLRAVQTPQGFRRAVLEQAHACAGAVVTDDAGLVEALGLPVLVIDGAPEAFKVTHPEDLARAEHLLAQLEAARQHGGDPS
jgi:2-C-methyl-D-erythritol 4-phosphate cytidylyltransferase